MTEAHLAKPPEPALAAVAAAALVGGGASASRRSLDTPEGCLLASTRPANDEASGNAAYPVGHAHRGLAHERRVGSQSTLHDAGSHSSSRRTLEAVEMPPTLPSSRPRSAEAGQYPLPGLADRHRAPSAERAKAAGKGRGTPSRPGTPMGESPASVDAADPPATPLLEQSSFGKGAMAARPPYFLSCGRCPCGRGVPLREAERWFREVAAEMQLIEGKLAERLQQCRDKLAAKDEVIASLKCQLQNFMQTSAQQSTWPRKNSSIRTRSERSSAPTPTSPAPKSSRQRHSAVLGSGEPQQRGLLAAARTPPGSSTGSFEMRGSAGGNASAAGDTRSGAGSASGAELRTPAEASERLQMASLRQEVARLRRQNSELTSTVKVRSSQVDSLTGMVRDMQLSAQRQLNMCRQQLDMRDDALQAMQDQLTMNRVSLTRGTAGSGSCSAIGTGAASPTPGGGGSGDVYINGRSGLGVGINAKAAQKQERQAAAHPPSSRREVPVPASQTAAPLLLPGPAHGISPMRRVCHVMPSPIGGIASPRGRRHFTKADRAAALAAAAAIR